MTTQIRFQPTLFLFLGTSAGQIGYRLKRHLQKAYGDIPVLQFMWIDIDTNIDPLARPHFSTHERVELSGLDPAAVIKNVNNYPSIREWWPETTSVRPGLLAGGGAPQQMRLIARLALFRLFNDRTRGPSLIDRLHTATDALFEIENIRTTEAKSNENIRYTVEPGCRVVMVFSPCGGTGGAVSFDIAYICRSLLQGKTPTIISVSILPPVIDKAMQSESQTQREKVRANTYAWFREDNFLSENPYWYVQYPEGAPVEVFAPPFDYRFIVDIENQAGYRLNSIDDVYNMVAQAIFMDTGSSIAGAFRGFTANVHALGELFEGTRRSFSSLAASALVFPKDRLLNYCAAKTASVIIREGLIGNAVEHEVKVATSSLLSQLSLRDTDLLPALLEQSMLKLQFEAVIKKTDSVSAAVSQIDTQEKEIQSAKQSKADKIKRVGAEILDNLRKNLDEEIIKIASNKGIQFATQVLDHLIELAHPGFIDAGCLSLDGQKTRVLQNGMSEHDLESARQDFNTSREALKKLDDGPEDVLERMVNGRGWKRKFTLFKNDALAAMLKKSEVYLHLAAQKQALEIYDEVGVIASALRSQLISAAARARTIAKELEARSEKLSNRTDFEDYHYEFLQEVEIDFEAYYKELSADIIPAVVFSDILSEKESFTINEFAAWIEHNLKTRSAEYSNKFFADALENTSILEVLREIAEKQNKNPDEVIEAYINRLVEYCHPFWQFDKDRGLTDLEGKSIIGVEDEQHPYLPESYKSNSLFELKTTGFRDRIDVVRIHHGLPAFLIRGMDDYKNIYERKRKGLDPLHVLPGAAFGQDLMPERAGQNRETFAIGLAFDYIVPIGTWYYYDPEKGYARHKIQPTREYRLGQGREKSESAFAHREDWVQSIDQKVEKDIRDMGNEAAIQHLDKAIEAHQQVLSKMNSEDTLRRQYEKEIKALKNLQRYLGKVG